MGVLWEKSLSNPNLPASIILNRRKRESKKSSHVFPKYKLRMSPRYLNTIPEISTSSDDITYNDEISSINDSSNEIRSSLSKDDRSIEIGDEDEDVDEEYYGLVVVLSLTWRFLGYSYNSCSQNDQQRLIKEKETVTKVRVCWVLNIRVILRWIGIQNPMIYSVLINTL